MSILKNLTTDEEIADEQDSVGSFGPVETGVYPCEVSMAYLSKSQGGALSLTLHLKSEGSREIRQTLWLTGGDAKGNKNYYERDGKKSYLPGFNQANSLCLLTLGKELSSLEPEEKVIKIYNFTEKAEVPTKVDVLTPLIGQEIVAAVFKQVVDKNVKNDSGEYVPSGETREENEIDKFFRAKDELTTAEIRAGVTQGTFIEVWRGKWSGVTRNRAKGGTGAQGSAGMPTGKPTSSLFS